MINGEIVVVPPPDPNSPDNGDTFVTLDAYHPDKQFTRPAVEICDQLPELPFHLIPQQHLASTINSGELIFAFYRIIVTLDLRLQ